MIKRIISILLLSVFCLNLCACGDDAKNKYSFEHLTCYGLRDEIVGVCDAYWNGEIDRDEAQTELEEIEESLWWRTSLYGFRHIIYSLNVDSYNPFAKNDRETLEYLEQEIRNYYLSYGSPYGSDNEDWEMELTEQVRKDILDVYDKYWTNDIGGVEACEEVRNIVSNWKEESYIVCFLDELDVLFYDDGYGYYLSNESDAKRWMDNLESYEIPYP